MEVIRRASRRLGVLGRVIGPRLQLGGRSCLCRERVRGRTRGSGGVVSIGVFGAHEVETRFRQFLTVAKRTCSEAAEVVPQRPSVHGRDLEMYRELLV
jgi:hypothetical protein